MKTQLFELGWGYWDEYEDWLYTHQNKTQEQFSEDVESLLIKYGDEYLDSEDSWAGANNWVSFIAEKLPELGYEKINPIRKSFSGGYILETNEPDSEEWKKIVGERLFNKAVEINKKIHDRL